MGIPTRHKIHGSRKIVLRWEKALRIHNWRKVSFTELNGIDKSLTDFYICLKKLE